MSRTTKQDELLTVIVPCLNEAEVIAETVGDMLPTVERLPISTEILLVDDGSTDGTGEVMARLCEKHECCTMRTNPRNLGLGRTVMNTLETLPSDRWVTVFPGDNEYYFESIESFVAVRDEYDVILGYIDNPVLRPLTRRVASNAFSRVANAIYGFRYTYLNGLKLYRVWAFEGLAVESSGHAYFPELLAKAILREPRLRVGEVPFAVRTRTRGQSKAIRPRSIARAVMEVGRSLRSVTDFRESLYGDE